MSDVFSASADADSHRAADAAVVGDWSEFEDDLSDAIQDSMDMDWNSRDGAKAVVRWLNENAQRRSAWLVEWPASDNMPVRYWHAVNGWMVDANRATHFSRRKDAEALAKRDHLSNFGLVAAEHVFGLSLAGANPLSDKLGGAS